MKKPPRPDVFQHQRQQKPNEPQAIADGVVGDPISAILQSRDPSPPPFSYVKGGGGLFKDMAIHDLDIARWLMSARGKNEAVSVYATGTLRCDCDQWMDGYGRTCAVSLRHMTTAPYINNRQLLHRPGDQAAQGLQPLRGHRHGLYPAHLRERRERDH